MNSPQPLALDLIVYDLDGTLVDAFDDIARGINAVFSRHQLPQLPMAQVRGHVGDGARMLVRRCLADVGALDRFDDIHRGYREYYGRNPAGSARLYPGVLETLEAVRARGIRQAVLTNKPAEVVAGVCDRLGIAARVDGLWGELEGVPRKPAPESLLRVIRHFGFPPDRCAMVGDALPDHRVARAAGVRMIAVAWGLLSRRQALALRPDRVIDRMPELLDLLA